MEQQKAASKQAPMRQGKGDNKTQNYNKQMQKTSFTYNADRVVGNGSFGVVFQATVNENGEQVAIKKVYQDKRYKNRELQIMKELFHPNVITLKHAFYTQGDKADEIYLNVVMDYVPETVFRILKHYNKNKQVVPMILVKLYTYQAFKALAYIHALGICHRDIKPQNLLVNPETHVLKVCDFGSAKRLEKNQINVSYICSRYYRAPELIFGATGYSHCIDVWSVGCVAAELLLGQPLFPGDSGVDQLVEIIKVLGTPTRDQIQSMNPHYSEFKFPHIRANQWETVFNVRQGKSSSTDLNLAIDMISKVLKYNPALRPKPLYALMEPFFDELRQPGTKLPNGHDLPEGLFKFSAEERNSTSEDVIKELIPEWYKNKEE